jgi:hypothetical protein
MMMTALAVPVTGQVTDMLPAQQYLTQKDLSVQ